jgi:predicted nucleotidyltransferase
MSVKNVDSFIKSLEERAKELNCLYKIEELFNQGEKSLTKIFNKLTEIIPTGFQYIQYCDARITYEDNFYHRKDFIPSEWMTSVDLFDQEKPVGKIEVFYTIQMPIGDDGPFLKEEKRLIKTIADRTSHFLLYRKMKKVYESAQNRIEEENESKPEWSVVLNLLRQTDKNQFSVISRKMIIYLFCRGLKDAIELFSRLGNISPEQTSTEVNKPTKKQMLQQAYIFSDEIFEIASKHLTEDLLLELVLRWINEERTKYLVKIISNYHTPVNEITEAMRKYLSSSTFATHERSHVAQGTKVALIRKFLSDQLEFINIAKNFSKIEDFDSLLKNLIYPTDSHGKVGGKAAGLFLAKKIIESCVESKDPKYDLLKDIKTPKTWYITSDGVIYFMYYNNLEDIIEQKYKDINDVRSEYGFVIQAIKNSTFPPELVNGLSRALDDFGDNPIIVRSSSLLEDRLGAVFAGKYKSLFLANQGTKQEKLEALCDAVAEVYASVFGPDPIGYRIERGLLDFNEEMGIMIQEVVGTKVGEYFFPAFAGVAFSYNEFRWSPRINREDGLIRIVPGLGTRAVDRIGNDYPILIAPGKMNFRLNQTYQQIIQYSPKQIDLINLRTNSFETTTISEVIEEVGNDFPMINQIFSIRDEHYIKPPIGLGINTHKDDIYVTFENLLNDGRYIRQLDCILKTLSEKLDGPIDIEFAISEGTLYLLQSRPQSSTSEQTSDVIPSNIPDSEVLFHARKYVTNGKLPDIQYIVYVKPEAYTDIQKLDVMKEVGIAVGLINRLLPKKTFILMGPGRWGSRGDIRLGVSVTYSDINNSAMLIEIAKAKGNYVPDLSFGTHFFQDLVESGIKYLPLYPDEDTSSLNENMLQEPRNILSEILPDYSHLSEIIKVINISESFAGKRLRLLMNADDNEAIGFLTEPSLKFHSTHDTQVVQSTKLKSAPWQIRQEIAFKIAKEIEPMRFGIKRIYLFGTVFHQNASDNSDIDFLVHYDGNEDNRKKMEIWFEAWNLSLSEMLFNQTGIRVNKLLDIFYVTDNDLLENDYFAGLIEPQSRNSVILDMKVK